MIVMESRKEHPRILIEEWFPFQEVGIECRRERGASSALPPISFLHVWWARRPLTVSKAAILGSILSQDFPKKEFLKLMNFSENIRGEFNQILNAKKKGERIKNPYSKDRAFKFNLDNTTLNNLVTSFAKPINEINLLDPMTGGGSIPLEAIRLNLNTYASDLNPVATIINIASLYFPLRFGTSIISKIIKYSEKIFQSVSGKILKYYPNIKDQENQTYIWVRTVQCHDPNCNLKIPLSPNWILTKEPKVIIQIKPPLNYSETECEFRIIENPSKKELRENTGTITKGVGTCPRCNVTLTSDYIKNEAQSGRMGHQLITIVYNIRTGPKKTIRKFRTPIKKDLLAIDELDKIIEKKKDDWFNKDLIPNEDVKEGAKTRELLNKGIDKWYKLCNNRQLFTNISIVEAINDLKQELLKDETNSHEELKAIFTYIHFAFDKIVARNCILAIWDPNYKRAVHIFGRHDFAFKWSYVEMDIIRKGFNWAIMNVLKAYKGILGLIKGNPDKIQIMQKPAQKLDSFEDNSIEVIVVDPPYYDNVMYAELSDFYYVWMKKNLGDLYPKIFSDYLTDKDNEAVANTSKFEDMGKSKKKLAKQDYEAKMRICFEEMNRVLTESGVLTIMFTHKTTDAWDTLTTSLMDAGFEITASWPVHTESDQSLFAKKNSVKSTILLICRKRVNDFSDLWWEDDILPSIRSVVADKAKEFRKIGIDGIDLFISCFGPALKEFSKSYPIRNISGQIVRAEEAIEAARKVVIDITLQEIIKGKSYSIDQASKFYLTAWHFFKARKFPFDEARRLALSIGINIEDLKTSYKLLNKRSGDVELILPKEREKVGTLNIDNPTDNGILINAVHLAILAYEEGGKKLYDNVIEKLRRNTDKSFRLYMETLFSILPDVKDLAKNLPEKKILGEILMTTEEKITPKGGKITDFLDK